MQDGLCHGTKLLKGIRTDPFRKFLSRDVTRLFKLGDRIVKRRQHERVGFKLICRFLFENTFDPGQITSKLFHVYIPAC